MLGGTHPHGDCQRQVCFPRSAGALGAYASRPWAQCSLSPLSPSASAVCNIRCVMHVHRLATEATTAARLGAGQGLQGSLSWAHACCRWTKGIAPHLHECHDVQYATRPSCAVMMMIRCTLLTWWTSLRTSWRSGLGQSIVAGGLLWYPPRSRPGWVGLTCGSGLRTGSRPPLRTFVCACRKGMAPLASSSQVCDSWRVAQRSAHETYFMFGRTATASASTPQRSPHRHAVSLVIMHCM